MAKIWNIAAFFITEMIALFLTYMFWTPATNFVSAMDGIFKPVASVILMSMLIFGTVIGPILVLSDENLEERFKRN